MAALHSEAMTPDETDWPQIVALYGVLGRLRPTPVVTLNRVVAVAMADGPSTGLRVLDDVAADLGDFHLFATTRAELLLRDGQAAAAVETFDRAPASVGNEREHRHHRMRRGVAVERAAMQEPNA